MSCTALASEETKSQTKMNSSNLYATTTKIILKSDPRDPESWKDLYRLIPYLRNSLCCVVCTVLLVDPLTPKNAQCAHHLCSTCLGGRKKIKPRCENCKDCEYKQNTSLRILLQLYKKMCLNLMNSKIFKCMEIQARQPGTGFESGASNLIQLIQEGANLIDNYESQGGIPKSKYSILPCIYTNSTQSTRLDLYSLVKPGSGNINISYKNVPSPSAVPVPFSESTSASNNVVKAKEATGKATFKKQYVLLKKGCRCGNATPTPGPLTCCGQRCPCYVGSKSCVDCKCRGCRNPHRPDGNKVMSFIPELEVPRCPRPLLPIPDIPLPPPQIFQQTPSASLLSGAKESTKPVMNFDANLIPTGPFNSLFKGYKCDEENIQLDSHLFPTESSQFEDYKSQEEELESITACNNATFKKRYVKLNKGCRCGNSTTTSGKLTCCGQRCSCYIQSKACIDCKCRGCRNPHRPDDNKVMSFIPAFEVAKRPRPQLPTQDIPLPPPEIFQQIPFSSLLSGAKDSIIEVMNFDAKIPTVPFNSQFVDFKCDEENIQLNNHLFPIENSKFEDYQYQEEDLESITVRNNVSNLVYDLDFWNDNM